MSHLWPSVTGQLPADLGAEILPVYRPDGLAQLPDVAGTRGEAHHGTYVGVLHAALAAVAAYVRRLRTGEGAYVDVAMADAGASCLMDHFFYLLSLRPEERPEP